MNKTKEEVLEEFTKYNDAHPSYFSNVKMSEAQFDAFINTLRGFVNQETTHLTDQIKSMENLENKVKEYEELMMDLEDSYMDWIDAEGTQNDGRFSVEVNNIRIKAKALTN